MECVVPKCWNCSNAETKFNFFCSKCSKIQKPIEVDSFKLFSLPYDFVINIKKLEDYYYSLQNKLHPDMYLNSSKEESYFSQIHSSNINIAYEKLINPVSRANELLKVFGFLENNENNSFTDTEILSEIIELQEEAENFKSIKEQEFFTKKIKDKIQKLIKNLEEMFKSKKFIEANKLNIEISYLEKIKNNLQK